MSLICTIPNSLVFYSTAYLFFQKDIRIIICWMVYHQWVIEMGMETLPYPILSERVVEPCKFGQPQTTPCFFFVWNEKGEIKLCSFFSMFCTVHILYVLNHLYSRVCSVIKAWLCSTHLWYKLWTLIMITVWWPRGRRIDWHSSRFTRSERAEVSVCSRVWYIQDISYDSKTQELIFWWELCLLSSVYK